MTVHSFSTQHNKREDYQNCSALYSISQLCTHTHISSSYKWTMPCWFSFGFLVHFSTSFLTYACFPPSHNVTCRNISILRFAKTYVKILYYVRYFYVLPKFWCNVSYLWQLRLLSNKYNSVLFFTYLCKLRPITCIVSYKRKILRMFQIFRCCVLCYITYITDRHVWMNGTLRYVVVSYVTSCESWKQELVPGIVLLVGCCKSDCNYQCYYQLPVTS